MSAPRAAAYEPVMVTRTIAVDCRIMSSVLSFWSVVPWQAATVAIKAAVMGRIRIRVAVGLGATDVPTLSYSCRVTCVLTTQAFCGAWTRCLRQNGTEPEPYPIR